MGLHSLASLAVIILTACMARPVGASAAAGELDETFGIGGRVDGAMCLWNRLVVQSDGKIIVAGNAFSLPGPGAPCIARHLPDGDLDPSFGTGGITLLSNFPNVDDLQIDSSGSILVQQSEYPGTSIIRVLSDGTLDGTFGSGGIVAIDDNGGAFALQLDDKIVTAHADVLADDLVVVRRHLPDGSLDGSFGTLGEVSLADLGLIGYPERVGVDIRSDGQIVVAGSTGLVRLESDGTLDPSFGTDGVAVNLGGVATNVRLQPDDKILVRETGARLRRYLADGALDGGFGTGGLVDDVDDIAGFQTGGRILAVYDANGSYSSGLAAVAIRRLLPSGAADVSFGEQGAMRLPFTFLPGAALLPDGRIVAGHDGRLVVVYGGTCGDGTLDLGEDCDDGNTAPGDGCDPSCCTADTDGDGRCDAYDPCTAAATLSKGRFTLRGGNAFGQGFVVKGQATFPSPIDPLTTGMRLILRNPLHRFVDAPISGGSGWVASGHTWRWEGNVWPGVERVIVRTSLASPGLVKVKVRGHGPLDALGCDTPGPFFLGCGALPISFEITFDARVAPSGLCGQAAFGGPPPAPSCARKGTNGVICR